MYDIMMKALLSLYSTRTQNYWRWVLLRRLTQKIVLLRYLTQKIPTCWYLWRWVKQIFRVLPDAKPKICVSPDANPRRQSVEYRWRWASGVGAGVGHVHFMFFVLIQLRFVANANPVSGGIWALHYALFHSRFLFFSRFSRF